MSQKALFGYVPYQGLADFIDNDSDANLSALSRDPLTGNIMTNAYIYVLFYNNNYYAIVCDKLPTETKIFTEDGRNQTSGDVLAMNEQIQVVASHQYENLQNLINAAKPKLTALSVANTMDNLLNNSRKIVERAQVANRVVKN
jgi:hypothetical protein